MPSRTLSGGLYRCWGRKQLSVKLSVKRRNVLYSVSSAVKKSSTVIQITEAPTKNNSASKNNSDR